MDPFERFYPYIERNIAGVPEPALRRAVRDAGIEVFRETGFWREYQPGLTNLVANQAVYEILSPEPNSTVCDIERMTCNGGELYKRERDWIETRYKHFETDTAPVPMFYFITEWTDASLKFQLYPIPNAATTNVNQTGLTIRCSLCPTLVSSYLPPDAYNLMRRTISAVALTDLFGQRAMPWYDPQERSTQDAVALKGKQDLRVQREFGWGKTVATVQTGALGMWQPYP
ncbi:MAG: hypothetical protein KGL39_06580 [Patescibacteria group bacterium]|nr:hypothetical protein [Patescibacteria group bacterium]